ncbi:MAG: enoyl-CoA hydratase-related protein [Candidatus Dormibacteraceae bacterium]
MSARGEWAHFDYQEREGVGTVTFTRPERLNALTFEIYRDLRDLAAGLRDRSADVRVLVLRGEGRGFCSGGDVEDIIGRLVDLPVRDVYDFARMTGACVRNLREMPQPVVAAVNGVAAGAGAVLAAASDLRVLAESASFQFLFTRIGISGGDMGVGWLLPRLVGLGRASELLLLGDPIDAETARSYGLATSVVPDQGLDAAVSEIVGALLQRGPWGLAMTKEVLNRGASMDLGSGVEMEAWTQSLLMSGEDFRAFYAGHRAKTPPVFRGR